ncbi:MULTISPECIES: hypothetical protein [Colwellia]|uniref:Uncharacterized protein n=1 Tax=Colwellia marinimaniae TaxID=1513592 RepID=A0ABQ0MXK9_9GAMM|nr:MULTISPECIES: hypothetical protein [Colwellia]GAW97114.1 hypothetical protein MTCD1_02740 [Colwellia marinimaniae]
MKTWLVIILLAITSTTVYSADEIKPFISDGCSSFPDGTLEDKDLWLSCCTAHDFSYWVGGTYQDCVEADESLRQCVTNVGEPVIAKLMLAGVRVGGTPYLPTKFRWGYGWPYPRGYKVINEQENKKVQAQLKLLGNDR